MGNVEAQARMIVKAQRILDIEAEVHPRLRGKRVTRVVVDQPLQTDLFTTQDGNETLLCSMTGLPAVQIKLAARQAGENKQ